MKTSSMATNTQEPSFSFSKRFFNTKRNNENDEQEQEHEQELDMETEIMSFRTSSSKSQDFPLPMHHQNSTTKPHKKKLSIISVSKLRSALSFRQARTRSGLGPKVIGTLFGNRRGHVRFAFQDEFKQAPAFLVELATPTSILVKEMASGLVRIALECDKKSETVKTFKLLEEPIWRTYCNGKKCGYAMRRDCGVEEWNVLNSIGPISMGAGVLPGTEECDQGEMMYMRAKFERVVGSKDSEAFYMMNPDGNGGPELSVYLLRV